MILLIDAGNTRVKTAVVRRGSPVLSRSIPTFQASKPQIEKLMNGASRCFCSSVVPGIAKHIRNIAAEKKIKVKFAGYRDMEGMRIKYRNPGKIGADRVATILGALSVTAPPFIIVDIGTAVTCELINGERVYCGGVIFPGFAMSINALAEKTALLPVIKFRRTNHSAGRDTGECISKGVLNAVTGGIEKTVRQLRKISPGAKVMITGAGTDYLGPEDLKFKTFRDRLLVFRGLLQLRKKLV